MVEYMTLDDAMDNTRAVRGGFVYAYEGYAWTHDCKAMPHYGKPIRLVHVNIDRCIYCGEISPREQGRVDAASVALLKETSEAEPSGA